MSGRLYDVIMDQVAVTAAQDLFNITATANMAFKIWRIELGQRTLSSWEAKPVRLTRWTGTLVAGTGGTAATPAKTNFGDAAATVTARVNDTTAASGTTSSIMLARDFEFLNGLLVVYLPDERPVIAPNQLVALNLPVAPSGSMTVSGTITIEELF